MTLAGQILCVLGALVVVVAGVGLFVLPDALARQHAGTKATTLGLSLALVGAGLLARDPGWTVRLVVLGAFLLVTLPLASHLLGRATLRESGQERDAKDARRFD